MAKLRDERFMCPGGLNSDSVTCLNMILLKQLSNGACQSILFKLIMAILRNETSEALRRRYVSVKKLVLFLCTFELLNWLLTTYLCVFSQYALLLSYFQYCEHMLDANVPTTVLQNLLLDEREGEDLDLQKVCSF